EGSDSTRFPAGQSHDPVLTDEAKESYLRRYRQIETEQKEAGDQGDGEEYERLENEKRTILNHLAKAKGLKGRDRSLGPASEAVRAHDRVEKAIQAVYARLTKKNLPTLAAHLKKHLQSEEPNFAYRPDVPAPDWKVAF